MGEAAGLTADRISFERGSVLIEQSLKLDGHGAWGIGLPKGGRWRRIGLDDDVLDVLRRHLGEHPPGEHVFGGRGHALVFTTPDGRPLDRNNFRRDV